MLYFAYGSNLLRERLLLRNPSAALCARGRLQVRAGRAERGAVCERGAALPERFPGAALRAAVGFSCVLPCLRGLVQGPYSTSALIRARIYISKAGRLSRLFFLFFVFGCVAIFIFFNHFFLPLPLCFIFLLLRQPSLKLFSFLLGKGYVLSNKLE